MQRIAMAALLAAAWVGLTQSALAWSDEGHELVGSVADGLLAGTNAGRQVDRILGYKLQLAAKWPDCVRSVSGPEGGFRYNGVPSGPCEGFKDEVARMENYARRNWTNCTPDEGGACHKSYHFADIAVQRSAYSQSYFGANNHDIVSAINSAVRVLQGQRPLPPFSIRDKKEAILLIAHFVGDMHQPLHVGSIYLREDGTQMDPDIPVGQNKRTILQRNANKGGNSLKLGDSSLHGMWDDVPDSWGHAATPEMIAKARAVPASSGQIQVWPALWASEIVRIAPQAFRGLQFRPKQGHTWEFTIADPNYQSNMTALKERQIIIGGARLAEFFKEIWPDN